MVCVVCNKRAYSEYCVQHKPRKAISVHVPRGRKNKYCKHCQSQYHLKFQCPKNPNKPPKRNLTNGKTAALWKKTRNQWFEDNIQDFYLCHYCKVSLHPIEVTLDHKIPRSRAPELKYDLSNLVPSCWNCNGLKGSVAHDDYPHDCM